LLQRPYWFALVDEADNVLIDEARTPLIISSPPGEAQAVQQALFRFAAGAAETLERDHDFEYDQQKQTCELLGRGRSRVRAIDRPAELDSVSLLTIYDAVERAVRARQAFVRDRQYVVRDGKIVIIDEFTGRAAEGRTWRDGLHQAVEAKEGIEVTVPSGHAARITIQDLFARWPHLAGMTGTIATSAGEISRTYGVAVAGFCPTLTLGPAAISIQDDCHVLRHIIGHQFALERAFIQAINQIAHSLRLLPGLTHKSRRRVLI
jgi:preprotein translocase subunit SecA